MENSAAEPVCLFTLGHSRHPLPHFLSLLQASRVAVLVDVRSSPHSRFNPHFNRKRLEESLAQAGIAYIFMGERLGGRPDDPACWRAGPDGERRVDFRRVMQQPWFQEGISDLLEAASAQTCAVLCAEEDPAGRHRHHLIAVHLLEKHPQVENIHLRGDGSRIGAAELHSRQKNPLNKPGKET